MFEQTYCKGWLFRTWYSKYSSTALLPSTLLTPDASEWWRKPPFETGVLWQVTMNKLRVDVIAVRNLIEEFNLRAHINALKNNTVEKYIKMTDEEISNYDDRSDFETHLIEDATMKPSEIALNKPLLESVNDDTTDPEEALERLQVEYKLRMQKILEKEAELETKLEKEREEKLEAERVAYALKLQKEKEEQEAERIRIEKEKLEAEKAAYAIKIQKEREEVEKKRIAAEEAEKKRLEKLAIERKLKEQKALELALKKEKEEKDKLEKLEAENRIKLQQEKEREQARQLEAMKAEKNRLDAEAKAAKIKLQKELEEKQHKEWLETVKYRVDIVINTYPADYKHKKTINNRIDKLKLEWYKDTIFKNFCAPDDFQTIFYKYVEDEEQYANLKRELSYFKDSVNFTVTSLKKWQPNKNQQEPSFLDSNLRWARLSPEELSKNLG
jgi:chemotaxis protein histidine kinase CheA